MELKVSHIKLNKYFGDWCVTQYIKKEYDELGSIKGGYIKLTNQATFDTIEILNDKALRADKWFTQSIKGIRIQDKSANRVLEKAISSYNKESIMENQKFNYMLLSRLVQDCEYFLNNGQRSIKCLWADSVENQIEKMKELWNTIVYKPEWLSMEDIEKYEKQMEN